MDELFPEETPPRPPIAQAPLSVILLMHGATSDAAESVSAWQAHLATLDRPSELLLLPVVEPEPNPVLDATRRLAYDSAHGLGPALQGAIHAAQHPLVVLATADREYQPADLQQLLGVIDKVDLVIGCRDVGQPALWRRVLGRVCRGVGWLLIGLPAHPPHCAAGATPWRRRWVARWAFGVRLADPESAFRLMRRDATARIVLQSRSSFALVEQLAKANHLELILAEEPVGWSPPAAMPAEPAPFASEARALFGRPDFGPPALHVPPPAAAATAEKPDGLPTTPPPGSS
jgi:Glycosyl transferase family 2